MYNGVTLYRGPSMIDGAPIIAVATGLARNSDNSKTGSMVQTYILRADVKPTDAIRTGADASICGNCIHRGAAAELSSTCVHCNLPIDYFKGAWWNGTDFQCPDGEHNHAPKTEGRTCYVNVGQGPYAVWRAYQARAYPSTFPYDLFAGRVVRFGSYGDPAAVPVQIWANIAKHCAAHTGYTHQWRTHPELAPYCMASADSEHDARAAQRLGWRTFRVAMPCDNTRLENEARCPASAEAGKKLQCADCKACNGNATARRGSIVIQAHGGFAVMANIRRKAHA